MRGEEGGEARGGEEGWGGEEEVAGLSDFLSSSLSLSLSFSFSFSFLGRVGRERRATRDPEGEKT